MAKQITWERALVRTGFLFEKEGDALLFHYENHQNLQLLERMLKDLGVADCWQMMRFVPREPEVDEEAFLQAFHANRRSREDFPGEVDAILLHSLDPYIAGIVRWCTAIGIPTAMSCDGHGRRHASLYFQKGDEQYPVMLESCLSLLSGGKWQFKYQYQSAAGHFLMRLSQQEMRERGSVPGGERTYEQTWLLDVAEALQDHQNLLGEVVRSMKTVISNQSR
ncbi:hypothetical protein ABHN11_29680 [Brevibacillus centrosporus]|uniref:hypothetical protein n=1 Tax=Brevibacillus centrosporus TaxID=54910 RepID=UPI003D21BF3B